MGVLLLPLLASMGAQAELSHLVFLKYRYGLSMTQIILNSFLTLKYTNTTNMIIKQSILDELTEKAKASPRLRMNLDLRDSEEDTSQRMLNAIEPGSPLPIHRHQKTSETMVCLRGRLVVEYYDELERVCIEAIELRPNGETVALSVPIGQWHTARAIESGTVILEMKNGCYEPLTDADILQM